MTVLTTIPNGALNKDIRDTLNSMLARLTALEGGTGTPTPTPTPTVSLSGAQSHAEGNSGATLFTYAVTLSVASSTAVAVPWAFSPGSTSASDFSGGSYPTGSTVTLPAGQTTGTFTISVNGDTAVEPDEQFSVSITAPSGYAAGSSMSATGTIVNDDTAAPAGFARNGSTNPALKALLSSDSGVIGWDGDSTGFGLGGGITANGTTSSNSDMLANARPYRPSAVVAGLMSSASYPAVDNGFIGTGVLTSGAAMLSYDSRITGTVWAQQNTQDFSGGGYYTQAPNSAVMNFTLAGVDTFVFDLYNTGGGPNIQIDGGKPTNVTATAGATIDNSQSNYTSVTVPSSNNGITRVIVTCATVGTHTISFNSGACALRGVRGYNSAAPGIRFVNNSGNGLLSANLAASSNGWEAIDTIVVDGAKLGIINIGLNDVNQGVATATTQANVNARIGKYQSIGADVLLIAPNAANPSFASTASQDALHSMLAATAASAGVAFGDLRTAFGDWNTIAARTADNLVHPNRGFYADIGAYVWNCIKAMSS